MSASSLARVLLSTILLHGVLSNPAEDSLRSRLKESIHPSIPISHHAGETLHVELSLRLRKIIQMDEQNEVLYSQYWLQFTWVDYRLTWNVSEFGGLDMIYLPVSEIWTPDIFLFNNAEEGSDGGSSPQSNYVRLMPNGTCVWWPLYDKSVSLCHIDVTWFPFDEQHCDLLYESWKYNSSQINMTAVLMPATQYHYEEGEQWHLVDIHVANSLTPYGCCYTWARGTFMLHLRRKYLYYIVHLIVPYFLFSLIAILTFVLQPSRPERLGLGMTILLTLSVYQLTVHNQLPDKSDTIPLLSIYFSFVLILCFLSLATTMFVVNMHIRAVATPISPLPPTVKRLACGRLAALLCYRMSSAEDSRVKRGNDKKNCQEFNCGGDDNDDREDAGQPNPKASAENNPVLTSILGLLETRISMEVEDRERRDRDARMRRDWMLAAAVIDRLSFIAMIMIFTVGTLVFVLLFALTTRNVL